MANRNRFINPLFQRTDPEATPLPGFEEQVQTEEVAEEEEASEAQPAATTAPTPAPTPLRGRGRPQGARTARVTAPETYDAPAEDEPPVKFTFYFSPAQLRQLDDLWVHAKLDHGQKVSKSGFVRLAVARLLDEFDKNPTRVLRDLKRERG